MPAKRWPQVAFKIAALKTFCAIAARGLSMSGDSERGRILAVLYRTEVLHRRVYRHLAERERDNELRRVLMKLSSMEERHAALWGMLVGGARAEPSERHVRAATTLITIERRILGLAIAVKSIEYVEMLHRKRLDRVSEEVDIPLRERRIIEKIASDDARIEEPLERKIVELSPVLTNIRDVVLGMNDGLVEILAATVGLGAALQAPMLILLGGLIVAVSGTLSMAGGAYISTEYEGSVQKGGSDNKSARKSALYMGVSYIFGSVFPLLPFALGMYGFAGIGMSVLLTAIVLGMSSMLMAVVSGTSVVGRVARTLAISLGAASVTIVLGYYARSVLHISV
jgi:VIT1/CCC1 family predicted Fe2+/Mn2+ transporter